MMLTTDRRTGIVRDIGLAIERQGWKKTAELSGVDRTSLHRSFGRNWRHRPSLETIEQVLPHLGLQLAIRQVVQ